MGSGDKRPERCEENRLPDDAFHAHLRARMQQRGISREEVEITLNSGWSAEDAKAGTLGKVRVFPYNAGWEGNQYPEKEVTVYYRVQGTEIVVLTAKARYGVSFPRKGRE